MFFTARFENFYAPKKRTNLKKNIFAMSTNDDKCRRENGNEDSDKSLQKLHATKDIDLIIILLTYKKIILRPLMLHPKIYKTLNYMMIMPPK